MNNKPDALIKSMLGKDFFEVLQKSDIYKVNNRNATSLNEISTGLKIVPRTVMSFLISNLSNLEMEESKNLELPFASDCYMQVTKKDQDTFKGYIYSKGKIINEFINRSIPGIGLVLMTTFELYDIENLKDSRKEEEKFFDVSKLQKIIDDRLMLHSLISRVVDQKIAQRDALEILVKEKISQALSIAKQKNETKQEVKNFKIQNVEKEETKSDKLKNFLEKQKNKKVNIEAEIQKREKINCPDCGTGLYCGGNNLTLCICYGEDWNKDIKIKKNEKNIKMKFPKSMDKENIEMLLNTLKNINKE